MGLLEKTNLDTSNAVPSRALVETCQFCIEYRKQFPKTSLRFKLRNQPPRSQLQLAFNLRLLTMTSMGPPLLGNPVSYPGAWTADAQIQVSEDIDRCLDVERVAPDQLKVLFEL